MPADCIFHCRTKRLSSSSSLRSWAKIRLLALRHPRTDMAPITFEASLPHPDDTDKLGSRLADAVSNEAACVTDHGLAIRLQGNLGAGKTSLVRAMLRRFGFAGAVKSPTFSLVETYPIGALTLNHFDFYRFEEPEEFEDARFSRSVRPRLHLRHGMDRKSCPICSRSRPHR